MLRTVSEHSFEEDPLRLVRGLRFVSQLDFEPDEWTLAQMEEHAELVTLVSGERDRRRSRAPTGWGSSRSSCSGAEPRKALRLARDTGVLVALLPEFAEAILFDSHSTDHEMTVEEHIFAVVQAAADAGTPLRVRLATLFHDVGKPFTGEGEDHAEHGARLAAAALRRLRYPTELRERVVKIVRFHQFALGEGDARGGPPDARPLRRRPHLRPDRPLAGRPPRPRSDRVGA